MQLMQMRGGHLAAAAAADAGRAAGRAGAVLLHAAAGIRADAAVRVEAAAAAEARSIVAGADEDERFCERARGEKGNGNG